MKEFIVLVVLSVLVSAKKYPPPPEHLDDEILKNLGAKVTFFDDFNKFSWYGNGGTWQTWYVVLTSDDLFLQVLLCQ
jgi:hypothetical protein